MPTHPRFLSASALSRFDVVMLPDSPNSGNTEVTIAKINYGDPVAGMIKVVGTDGVPRQLGGSQRVEIVLLH